MRQYQIPQFITIEDKVIGPLTVKQALFVGGGALLIVFVYINLQGYLFWPIAMILGASAGMLAFGKINGQPFPAILKNAVLYLVRPRLFVWKQNPAVKKPEHTEEQKTNIAKLPKISESRLSDLAWSLDVKEMWKNEEQYTEKK